MRDRIPAPRRIPSIDEVLRTVPALDAIERFGRPSVVEAVRHCADDARVAAAAGEGVAPRADEIVTSALARLERQAQPRIRPVFNLTGTVLHTNLGGAGGGGC